MSEYSSYQPVRTEIGMVHAINPGTGRTFCGKIRTEMVDFNEREFGNDWDCSRCKLAIRAQERMRTKELKKIRV